MPKSQSWEQALLSAIGAPVTKQNINFLRSWQRWEGGHTHNKARYNWLNTTRESPGATGSINRVGVKAFQDFQSGIGATVATLQNGRYDDIVRGLRSGNPYGSDVTAGLSTWVSGSPTARLDYAHKVLGAAPKASQSPRGGGGAPRKAALAAPRMPKINLKPLQIAFADDPEFLSLLEMINQEPEPTPVPGPEHDHDHDHDHGPKVGVKYSGKTMVLPTSWKPTHPTDGLGWGTHSAVDIMGKPGTPVGAPEDGVIMRWNPTGAQGGGSMWFRAKSGKTYWIGHIANGLTPGTKVKRGQVIASISADHPRPHVHLDVRR